ncbi:peptide/nickel transport system substrate-binding protein [Catenuloplanes nepalensis]|uniref:Peptide/nickel transport system substrate-binding protein n=1 Tax=Catenuloplanes nepalensis TaxID=587533 RepID=A0ABT9MVN2_9ACTN|nr:ABC transporter substrate-binding protein [Catenuloplanes nepalensis]MDP9795066.1 peptide/nickel transport system substrate-binding protein [Catenuloplanes nepalensis]
MRARHTLAVAATVILGLTACNANPSAPPGETGAQKGGTLRILSSASEFNLDPAKSQTLAITSGGLVLRRLTTWDIGIGKSAKPVPDLATDTGTTTDGGKTWTYTLKDGLTYPDGSPITTRDIKYGLERSFAPELGGGLGYHKALLAGGDAYKGPYGGASLPSIATPDDRTITFTLKTAYGDWPWIASMPAFAPVPKASDDPADYGRKPVPSGPYQIESYTAGVEAVLSRNPAWKQETDPVRTAGPDKIIFQLGQDTTVAAQRLVANSGDDQSAFGANFVPPAQLAQAAANPAVKDRLVTSSPGALAYLAINTRRVTDVRVRQALNYAADKRAYQVASGGDLGGSLATTLITPGIPGRAQYNLYPADPAGDVDQAKRLLAEAGQPAPKLTLLTRSDGQWSSLAQALQQGYARAGIQVEIRTEEYESWFEHVTSGERDDYDLTLTSWQPDFPSPNGNIQPLFASSEIGGGGFNLARYSNPKVDALIEQATAEVDPTKSQALWAHADNLILQDAPVVPLIYTKNTFLRGSKVANFFIGEFPAYPNYLKASLTQ